MPKIVAIQKDWLELGFTYFSEMGESGLNVDKMSRVLKCNKSSFYWHFKTKKDFINKLIEYWINIDTNQIIAAVDKEESAKNKLLKLIEITFKKDANLDFIFYLKKYAQKNKEIQKIVNQIDKERMTYVAELLKEIGYTKEDARIKASLFYKFLIGYHEMIRYKKQKKNYLSDVLYELNHFIKI